ncbi:MAG TPA: hypothetical protein VF498_14995 [Anaerolineales bacterium]
MKRDRLESWLQNIYHTQDEEISCTECFDLVSGFVELELSGENPAAKMPQVLQHLSQCSACREEYETLRDIRRFENEGGALSLDDLKGSIH